jgi:hypothetical protein
MSRNGRANAIRLSHRDVLGDFVSNAQMGGAKSSAETR